jgi:hypothetical protein
LAGAFPIGVGRFAEAARLIGLGVGASRASADSLRSREREDDHLMIDAAAIGRKK